MKIKKILYASLIATVFSVVGFVTLQTAQVSAVGSADVCAGLEATGGSCTAGPDDPTVESTVQQVIRILSYIVGVISVIMIIVGGFQYVTSGGDSGKVTSAKNTIMYALIGIVIVALAQIIVRFTINKATSGPSSSVACTAAITTGCTDSSGIVH